MGFAFRYKLPENGHKFLDHDGPAQARVAWCGSAVYNDLVVERLSPQQALDQLAAGAWDPGGLPAAESVPWGEVASLARATNTGGLVYSTARKMLGAMPQTARQFFEDAYYFFVAENARGQLQLAHVVRALAATGAPILLLKGAALGESVYESFAHRLMGDIDLLLPREKVPACRQALLDLGYTALAVEHQAGTRLAFSNQEAFDPPAAGELCVELHWHILDVPYHMVKVPIGFFWQQSEVCTIAGQSVRVLNTFANLVYLPAHLALHHQFRSFRSFVDLALLVSQQSDRIDWHAVGETARQFDLLSALRGTVDRMVRRWPSLPLAGAHRALAELRPSRVDQRLFRLLSAEERNTTLDFYTTLASLPDLGSRVRYAWFNLFPQREYMARRYGSLSHWALPYWYALRIGGGLTRLARAVPLARRLERQVRGERDADRS